MRRWTATGPNLAWMIRTLCFPAGTGEIISGWEMLKNSQSRIS